jgi:group I intron endonuclease
LRYPFVWSIIDAKEKTMTRCIYKIINVVNNKFYVGSAVNYEKRKARHLWRLRRGDHSNKHLQASWNMHGEKAFVFAVVETIPDQMDLLETENKWLREHVGKDYCYNIATDAKAPQLGMSGEKNAMWGKTFKHTEEAKAKISKAAKDRIQTEEEKIKRRETMRGKPQPAAVREKISVALSGEGNFWYGKKRPDHGAKISKAVEVCDASGSVTIYPSILAVREALGLKPPTINRALKSGEPLTRGPIKGWSFKYSV